MRVCCVIGEGREDVHAIVTTVWRNKYKKVCVCVCVCVCGRGGGKIIEASPLIHTHYVFFYLENAVCIVPCHSASVVTCPKNYYYSQLAYHSYLVFSVTTTQYPMWFSILEKMAVSVILALLFVSLLPGQGFSQCFTGTNCTGGQVVALDERDCCVGTDDGLSFSDGSSYSLCIGK